MNYNIFGDKAPKAPTLGEGHRMHQITMLAGLK